MVSANYEAYKSVMRQAFKDGQITPEESAILDTLRQSLNISSEEHSKIEDEIKQEYEGGGGPALAGASVNSNPNPAGNVVDDDINVIRPGMNSGEIPIGNEGAPPAAENSDVGIEDAGGIDTESEPEAPAPQSVEDLIKAGKSAYHKNDFQQAINYFDKAIELESDNSEALFFRKRSQSKLQESGGAAPSPGGVGVQVNPGAGAGAAPGGFGGGAAAAPQPAAQKGDIKGDPNCTSCNGAGTCRWCKATGGCYWCKGTGQCDKCKGTGITKGQQCGACAGSGKCHSCKGNGKCYWCQGSGRCSKCNV